MPRGDDVVGGRSSFFFFLFNFSSFSSFWFSFFFGLENEGKKTGERLSSVGEKVPSLSLRFFFTEFRAGCFTELFCFSPDDYRDWSDGEKRMPFITEFFLSFSFVFVHSTIIGSHRIRLGLFPNRELVTTSVVLVMFTGFYWVLRCLTRFSCQEKGCYRVLPSFFFPHKDSSESTTGSLKCSLWLFVVALATGVPVPVSALVPGSDEFLPSFFFFTEFH